MLSKTKKMSFIIFQIFWPKIADFDFPQDFGEDFPHDFGLEIDSNVLNPISYSNIPPPRTVPAHFFRQGMAPSLFQKHFHP